MRDTPVCQAEKEKAVAKTAEKPTATHAPMPTLQHRHREYGVAPESHRRHEHEEISGQACTLDPEALVEDDADTQDRKPHAHHAPPRGPFQPEHQAQEQSPDGGSGEDETGVGSTGHAHAEGESCLADRHPEAPQASHGEKVFRFEPVRWLQDAEEAEHQDTAYCEA